MSIIQKQDVSYLFSNMGNSSNSSSIFDYSFLSDYASIKSGSYSKLVKAYYSKLDSDGSSSTDKTDKTDKNENLSTSLSKDSAKKLTDIKSSTADLQEAADKLMKSDKDSLFVEKEVKTKNEDGTETVTKAIDKDAIYKAVSDFVSDYNKVIDTVSASDSSTVESALKNMTNITSLYKNSLEKIGISVGSDNKLSVDEKVFKEADINKIKDTFNKEHSFGETVSSQASLVNEAATKEGLKANTYTGNGTYSNNFSTGDMFNSLF